MSGAPWAGRGWVLPGTPKSPTRSWGSLGFAGSFFLARAPFPSLGAVSEIFHCG